MSEIETLVRERMTTQPAITTTEVPQKKSLAGFLGILILVMTLAIMGSIYYKRFYVPLAETKSAKEVVNNTRKDDFSTDYNRLNRRMDKLESDLSVQADRIWLLGVANSENANIQIELERRRGVNPDYIYFDANWKFNRMPKTLPMDDSQTEELKKYVK